MKKLTAAARAAFTAIRKDAPDDHFYFFALFTTEDGDYVCATAWSEEALARAVGTSKDADAQRRSLRFSAADSPFHEAHSEGFVELSSGKRLHDACFTALRTLDGEGLFGKGTARSKTLLNVVYGDMSDEKWLEHANRLNSRAAVARALPFLTLHEASARRGRVEAWGARAYQSTALSLSTDRARVAYSGSGGEVGILDVATRHPVFEKKRKGEHWASALAPDGSRLYLGDGAGVLALGLEGKATSLAKTPTPSTMAISRDGARLAVSSHSAPLRVFDITAGTEARLLWERPSTKRAALAFSPDGRVLAVATDAGVVCLDAASGEERWTLALKEAYTVCVAWAPDGAELFVSSTRRLGIGQDSQGAGELAAYAGETGKRRRTLAWTRSIDALDISASGRRIAITSERLLVVLDAKGEELARGTGTQESLDACAFVSEDVVLATGRDVNRGPALLSLTLD